MDAENIMTAKVITVTPGTSVGEIARLLSTYRISAVPVVEGYRLVGIVSEADLLHRYELGTDCTPGGEPWWIRVFRADHSPEDYVKSHARFARDIMTPDVVTVACEATLAEVAALMEKRRIKRVPVMDEDQLVGIVSRSDLVRALLSVKRLEPTSSPTDEAIRARLLAELGRQAWWQPEFSDVSVEVGVVTYAGLVHRENERIAARVAAETIPGVRGVVDRRMAYRDLPATV